MSKITPPTIFRIGVNFGEAIITLKQQNAILSSLSKRVVSPLVCKCCGAPLSGDKCEYCGVVYD